jgi:hypothetical protein
LRKSLTEKEKLLLVDNAGLLLSPRSVIVRPTTLGGLTLQRNQLTDPASAS